MQLKYNWSIILFSYNWRLFQWSFKLLLFTSGLHSRMTGFPLKDHFLSGMAAVLSRRSIAPFYRVVLSLRSIAFVVANDAASSPLLKLLLQNYF